MMLLMTTLIIKLNNDTIKHSNNRGKFRNASFSIAMSCKQDNRRENMKFQFVEKILCLMNPKAFLSKTLSMNY